MAAYSSKAAMGKGIVIQISGQGEVVPKTKKMQATRYKSIAFSLEEIGAFSLTLLNILISTRNRVTSMAILRRERGYDLTMLGIFTCQGQPQASPGS